MAKAPIGSRDILQAARANLDTLLSDFDALEAAGDELEDTKAKLDVATKQLAEVSAKIVDDKSRLDELRAAAAKKHDTDMYEKNKELRVLTQQVDLRKVELAELEVKVKAAAQHHEDIMNSVESLRKRFAA